jgi:hypothetical protein
MYLQLLSRNNFVLIKAAFSSTNRLSALMRVAFSLRRAAISLKRVALSLTGVASSTEVVFFSIKVGFSPIGVTFSLIDSYSTDCSSTASSSPVFLSTAFSSIVPCSSEGELRKVEISEDELNQSIPNHLNHTSD